MTAHVVIIGGGFGGLSAARRLARRPVRVTLIDRQNHHLFQPLLYQVATAGLSPADIASPIRSLLAKHRNVEVRMGEVTGVDLAAKRVRLKDGVEMTYDALIVAAGVRHAYFGRDDWEKDAPGLKTLDDALEIRRRVLSAFEAAETEPDAAVRDALLTFVVVGAGPTGVELAGAIAELARFTVARDFRAFDPRKARVVLVEAGPRMLSAFDEKLSDSARRAIEKLGVEVRLSTRVTEVRADGVKLGDAFLPARTVLWAAGVQGPPLARALGVELDRAGRVKVQADLTIPGHPDAYVVGDLASFEVEGGGTLPGLAPVASQQGQHAADNVLAGLEGRARQPFRYVDKGIMATVGRAAGIAQTGRLKLSGFPGWLAWLFIHILFLVGFRNRLLVMIQWTWAWFTYGRGARLITGVTPPPPRVLPEPSAKERVG
ncbi:MAG: NAD(P)/FAD-dependent oxidoreductase [Myxococcota bacterium]|jgi:NADH dehydrogenase